MNGAAPQTHGAPGTAISARNLNDDIRGIHVGSNDVTSDSAQSLTAALSVPGVDGLLLIIGWNELEPAKSKFSWEALDHWMGLADSLGKNVTLSIRAGTKTPAWLFRPMPGGAGVKGLDFSVARKAGSLGSCEPDTIAAPWDSTFLFQWNAMLASVADHLKTTGTYATVKIVRLTGINRDTDELHLPNETSESTGLSCVSDAIATWQQAGYRPSLLLQGWDSVTSCFQRNFPDKVFSVAIIASTFPFPPIAEDGSLLSVAHSESLSVAQNLPLLTLASKKFPGHLVIQNNTLYPTVPAQPQTVHAAQSLGTMIAFQTNEDLPPAKDKQAACGNGPGDTTSCTATTYLEMLETGIYPLGKDSTLRAQYIEVFAANARAFPEDILQAHLELTASSQTGVAPSNETPPSQFALYQNYPNPFNPTTTIQYTVSGTRGQGLGAREVRIAIYDVLGKEVATLVNARQSPGTYDVRFDGSQLPSGVYYYRFTVGSWVATKTMLLIK